MNKHGLRDARSKTLVNCVNYEISCLMLDAKSSGIKKCEYGKKLPLFFNINPVVAKIYMNCRNFMQPFKE